MDFGSRCCFCVFCHSHTQPFDPSLDHAWSLALSFDRFLYRLPDRIPAQSLNCSRDSSLACSLARPLASLARLRLIAQSRARSINNSIVYTNSGLVKIGRLWFYSKFDIFWAPIRRHFNFTFSYNRQNKQESVRWEDTRTLRTNETDRLKVSSAWTHTHTHQITHAHSLATCTRRYSSCSKSASGDENHILRNH